VNLYVPSTYGGQTPLPLVIFLHGYTLSGQIAEDWFGFRPLAEARGFLYCYPDGTRDSCGSRFWNAVDCCCDFGHSGVDDAGYLRSLIEEASRRVAVDRKQVYLIGHSNGGCMAYRMACQHANLIAGIASLAGTSFTDPTLCAPSQPVSVLHIHGTADEYVPYGPGCPAAVSCSPVVRPPWPGVVQNVQTWANYNGSSDPVTDAAPSLDLTTDIPGLDAVITRYATYPPGGAVELWTINGGTHIPTLSSDSQFSPRVIDWLLAHPKP
jgi:polyhydroxybutyrate depolymerase